MAPETTAETLNNYPIPLSDRELLDSVSQRVTDLSAMVATVLDNQDRDRKQLDHVDTMAHEIIQFIDEHRPALAKALGFLAPGRTMLDYVKGHGKKKEAPADGQG